MKLSETLQKSYTVEDLLDYADELDKQAGALSFDDDATEDEQDAARRTADAAIDFIAGLAFNGDKGAVKYVLNAKITADAMAEKQEQGNADPDELTEPPF